MINKLIDKLKKVKDERRKGGKRHELWIVLITIVLAIMNGNQGYRAIGDFGKFNQVKLTKILKIENKSLPSYSTIRRVMMILEWESLLEIFNEWGEDLRNHNDLEELLAIDGKSLRNTVVNHDNSQQNFITFVSMFSQKTGLVYKMKRFEQKKGSEIEQARDIVDSDQIKNAIFTMDAMHTQSKTIDKIIEHKNDYLIPVKRNQIKLYERIIRSTETQPNSSSIETDISHGRTVTRTVEVFKADAILDKKWKGIQTFIKVERRGIRKDKKIVKEFMEVHYYISSLSVSADVIALIIRGHWSIENNLHWVKDVIFGEDKSPIKDFNAATNLSILTTIGLNLFRLFDFQSITEGQRWLQGGLERILAW